MGTYSAAIAKTTRITTKMMFKGFRKKYPKIEITYNQFKKIVGDTHTIVIDECLKGGIYNFGNAVGRLQVAKFEYKPYLDAEGNLKGMRPDYGATKKHKKNGGTNTIYHRDKMKCRWAYRKNHSGRLKNKSVWAFIPTDGPKGISRKLHKHIESNPTCTDNYHQIYSSKQRIENVQDGLKLLANE